MKTLVRWLDRFFTAIGCPKEPFGRREDRLWLRLDE